MKEKESQLKRYLSQSHNLLNSLILVLPLLILYQVGLLLGGFRGVNGIDFVSQLLVPMAGPLVIVILNFVLLVLLCIGMWHLRKKERFDPGFFAPMVIESVFYAFFLGAFIVFVIRSAFPMAGAELGQENWLTKITISLGAGVYEELFFRLGLISLFTYFFVKVVKVEKATAVLGAFVVSSLLFSLAHFVGRNVEAYEFIYLFIAGLILAVLFKFRSFAIAVYTHAFYDIFVLFSRQT
jgi:membrane protease YdiL (CAAX protease family)